MCPVLGELHSADTYEIWLKCGSDGSTICFYEWKLHLYTLWSQVVEVAQVTLNLALSLIFFPHCFICFTKEMKQTKNSLNIEINLWTSKHKNRCKHEEISNEGSSHHHHVFSLVSTGSSFPGSKIRLNKCGHNSC